MFRLVNSKIIVFGTIFVLLTSGLVLANYIPLVFGTTSTEIPRPLGAGQFGRSVDITSSNIIVGSPQSFIGATGSAGKVFVFDTSAILQLTLENPTPLAGEQMGRNIAQSGNLVVAGVPSTPAGPGEAVIYDISTCDTAANSPADSITGDLICDGGAVVLSNPTPVNGEAFGDAVDISGNRVIVGAFNVNSADGEAYVFDTAGTLLLTLTKPSSGIFYGEAVAIEGNIAVVGAGQGGTHLDGEAYLYDITTCDTASNPGDTVNGDGICNSPELTLENPDKINGCGNCGRFGVSVSISGDNVLVGARNFDAISPAIANTGRAYLFDRTTCDAADTPGDNRCTVADIVYDNPTPNSSPTTGGDRFGWSVDVSGTAVVIGAVEDIAPEGPGRAYIFDTTSSTLHETLNSPNPVNGDEFGFSSAILGDKVVIGEPLGTDQAYLFDGDFTFPSVTITSSASPGPTNTSPIPMTATFSEAVSGFAEGDITVGNGNVVAASLITAANPVFTFNVNPTADGTVTVDIGSVVATAAGGGGNTAATQFSIVSDTTPPDPPGAITTPNGELGGGDNFINRADDDSDGIVFRVAGVVEGDEVELFEGATSLGTATVGAGDTTVDITVAQNALAPDGAKSITAKSTDPATNTSAASAAITPTRDTLAPEIISIVASDTLNAVPIGSLKIDEQLTFTLTPTIAEDGLTVTATYNSIGSPAFAFTTSNSGMTYVAVYTVAEGNTDQTTPLNLSGVTLTDPAGNTGAAAGATVTQTIDANRPTVAIDNNSFTTSLDTGIIVADKDVADVDTLDLTLTFNSKMQTTGADPAFAFPAFSSNDVSSTPATLVTPTAGAWTTTNPAFDVFDRSWSLADVGVTESGIDIEVSGAKDLAGNTMTANSQTDVFDVDTENPQIAPGTLTILSNNALTNLAKTGNTITIDFTATEALLAFQDGDVTIQGEADDDEPTGVTVIDTTPEDTFIRATFLVDALDTEGVTNFSIDCRDLVGNLCAADQTTPNVPEPATNLLTTDSSEVIIDNTAPNAGTLEIVGSTTPSDTVNARTFDRMVQLTFDCDDSNAFAIDENGALDSSKVAGCDEAKVAHDSGAFGAFAAITAATTNDVTLDAQRGQKDATVQYRDFLDHTDDTDSRHSDTIFVDAFFQNVIVTSTNPLDGSGNAVGEWEHIVFSINGEIVHPDLDDTALPALVPLDQVVGDFRYAITGAPTFDFPGVFTFPSSIKAAVILENCTDAGGEDKCDFQTITSLYPRHTQVPTDENNDTDLAVVGAIDHSYTPEVNLVTSDGSTAVNESITGTPQVDLDTSNLAVSLERPTTVFADRIEDPSEGNAMSTRGFVADDIVLLGVTDPRDAGIPMRTVVFDSSTGGTVNIGDLKLSDGLTVLALDPAIGDPLTNFGFLVKFVDADAGIDFDSGEAQIEDRDNDNRISAGDRRLADNSIVVGGITPDADVGTELENFRDAVFPAIVKFNDANSNGSFDPTEARYADADTGGDVFREPVDTNGITIVDPLGFIVDACAFCDTYSTTVLIPNGDGRFATDLPVLVGDGDEFTPLESFANPIRFVETVSVNRVWQLTEPLIEDNNNDRVLNAGDRRLVDNSIVLGTDGDVGAALEDFFSTNGLPAPFTIETLIPVRFVDSTPNLTYDVGEVLIEDRTNADPAAPEINGVEPIFDNMARLHVGAEIRTAGNPTYVTVFLGDSGGAAGFRPVTLTVHPPAGSLSSPIPETENIHDDNRAGWTLFHPEGVSKVVVTTILGSPASTTIGLEQVTVTNAELLEVQTLDFESRFMTPVTVFSFDLGRYVSSGIAAPFERSFDVQALVPDVSLPSPVFDDADYLPAVSPVAPLNDEGLPSDTRAYTTQHSTTFGIGGSASVVEDSGGGVISRTCWSDLDRDSWCDDWELAGLGAGGGIPFYHIKPDNSASLNFYQLLTSNSQQTNIAYEVDAMGCGNGDATCTHGPSDVVVPGQLTVDGTDLSEVELFERFWERTPGTPLIKPIVMLDNLQVDHNDFWTLWEDANDVDDDDFNSNKNDQYGLEDQSLAGGSEHPEYTLQSAQTQGIAGADDAWTLTLGGVGVKIPNLGIQPALGVVQVLAFDNGIGGGSFVLGGETMGELLVKVRLTTLSGGNPTDTTISAGAPSPTFTGPLDITMPNGALVDLRFPQVTVTDVTSQTGVQILEVLLPYFVDKETGTDFISWPAITIPLTLGDSMDVVEVAHNPGSPWGQTELLKAKAQMVRYCFFGHSFGGPSGMAELRGNDCFVSVGDGFGGTGVPGHTGGLGTAIERVGTWVHESGHNANLKHGGARYNPLDILQIPIAGSDIGCKSNYISPMNYELQTSFYIGDTNWLANPSFSDGSRNSLTEDDLGEFAGVDGGPQGLAYVFGLPGDPTAVVTDIAPNDGNPDTFGVSFTPITGPKFGADFDGSSPTGTPGADSSGDINNLGIDGCRGNGGIETVPYFDSNDYALIDLDFRQGPSGQIDGVTLFVSEGDNKIRFGQILQTATFEGLDEPPIGSSVYPLSQYEIGGASALGGSIWPILVQVKDLEGRIIEVSDTATAQVYLSTSLDATDICPDEEENPTICWVKFNDENAADPLNPDIGRYDAELQGIRFDVLVPQDASRFNDAPGGFDVEQETFYTRVVFFDLAFFEDPSTGIAPGTGIAGEKNNPDEFFLVDKTTPFMPGGENTEATLKIKVIKNPRNFKNEVILPELQAIRDTAVINDNTKSKLDTIIEKITHSLTIEFWNGDNKLVPETGQTVFQDEEAAAKELATLVGLPPSAGNAPTETNTDVLTELRDAAGMIDGVDRVLAQNAIDEASPGGICVANANIEMQIAENSLLLLDVENAINAREAAWVWAQQELAGLSCDPIGAAPPPPEPVPEPESLPGPGAEVIDDGVPVTGDRVLNIGESLSIINGGELIGNIMLKGGTLTVSGGSTVTGNIDASEGSSVTITGGSVVTENVLVKQTGGFLILLNSQVDQNVVTQELASVNVIGSTILQDLISDKDGNVVIKDNKVGGKIEIKEPDMCDEDGNTDLPGFGDPPGGNSKCP